MTTIDINAILMSLNARRYAGQELTAVELALHEQAMTTARIILKSVEKYFREQLEDDNEANPGPATGDFTSQDFNSP